MIALLCVHTAGMNIPAENPSDPSQNPLISRNPSSHPVWALKDTFCPSKAEDEVILQRSEKIRILSNYELKSPGGCVALQHSCRNSDGSGHRTIFRRCWRLLLSCQAKCHCVVAHGGSLLIHCTSVMALCFGSLWAASSSGALLTHLLIK